VLGFLGAAVINGWSRVTSFDWQFHAGFLALAVLATGAALTGAAVGYAVMLERLAGRRLPRVRLVAIWGRSLLGRYVPGNVVMFAGRVVLGREAGVSGRVSLAASAYEQGFSLGASAVVSVGFLLYVGDLGQGPWLWAVAVVPLGLVLLHPRVFERLSSRLLRRVGREPLEVFLSPRQMVLFATLYGLIYAVLAVGAWAATRAFVGPEVGSPLYVGAGFLLSFVVAMLAFVFPSGLGVREGVFALALARNLPGSVAIAVAAAARLVMTLVEVAFAGAVVALERGVRRRSQ
jgi:glycosyltransferase 2 family protein